MCPENAEDSGSPKPESIIQRGQSGGVNIYGGKATFKGDVAGQSIYKSIQEMPEEDYLALFSPLYQALKDASPEKKAEAEKKVEELKEEIKKGEKAEDSRVAKLVNGILDLVPGAVSAVVGMFATPILSGISGPLTKIALDKFRGD